MTDEVRVVVVDGSNVDEEQFFCYKSKPKTVGYAVKLEWLRKRFAEGMKMRVLYEGKRSVAFIEYIPGEEIEVFGGVKLSFSAGTLLAADTFSTDATSSSIQAPLDAKFTLGNSLGGATGITLTSSSNTVTDVVEGVTLNLHKVSTSAVTISAGWKPATTALSPWSRARNSYSRDPVMTETWPGSRRPSRRTRASPARAARAGATSLLPGRMRRFVTPPARAASRVAAIVGVVVSKPIARKTNSRSGWWRARASASSGE